LADRRVLEPESIPLSHRQTIRRSFEMIRPDQADTNGGSTTMPSCNACHTNASSHETRQRFPAFPIIPESPLNIDIF